MPDKSFQCTACRMIGDVDQILAHRCTGTEQAERAMRERERQYADEVLQALEESVRLQSHYATLLNGYDGGRRLTFASAEEWMRRLQNLRHFPRSRSL